jgi:uncharacterized protein (DUF1800 family)
MVGVPRYQGRFGVDQAERLLWRAGFGPRPGEAKKLARKGLKAAVLSLTRPSGKARLKGPAPLDDRGLPLAPADAWGHDHLWWLDRMVRSNQPLVERMTLVWHDWFATADIGKSALNIAQNELFRRLGLGSFKQLLLEVTRDPAMLVWLSGTDNTKWAPNENYARELMELFTLGAGAGYTEQDVREQARALTGWTNDWDDNVGYTNFRYEPDYHDTGVKRIFGRSGNFGWEDSCQLCLDHPAHEPYFVGRLWSYFVPTPPSPKTLAGLRKLYRSRGYAIRPLVEAILQHPDLYKGPRMVKPPAVQIAGMLRARKAPVRDESWIWISDVAGQRLFDPPNVAGWDESHWLDTARLAGRWQAAGNLTRAAEVDDESYDPREPAGKAVARALKFWGRPRISKATHSELLRFARDVEAKATEEWQQSSYRALRQNALRIMIATSPDLQTS